MLKTTIEFTMPCGCVLSHSHTQTDQVPLELAGNALHFSADVLSHWLAYGGGKDHVCPSKDVAP